MLFCFLFTRKWNLQEYFGFRLFCVCFQIFARQLYKSLRKRNGTLVQMKIRLVLFLVYNQEITAMEMTMFRDVI